MNAFAQSFTEPPSAPPNNNAAAPLDVGGSAQTKEAGLAINTGKVVNGQLLTAPVGLLVPYGTVGIDTNNPITSLSLNVNGKVGAAAYCDVNGNNCTTSLGSGPVANYNDLPSGAVAGWCSLINRAYPQPSSKFIKAPATGCGSGIPQCVPGWTGVLISYVVSSFSRSSSVLATCVKN